jgi:MoxR-like ATPase
MWSAKGLAEAILAFEEMNSAPPSVLAACYQIILDRRVGNYVLPDGVSVFACR